MWPAGWLYLLASLALRAPVLDRPAATGLDISPWIISSCTVTMLYPDIPPLSQRITAEFIPWLCECEGLYVAVQRRTATVWSSSFTSAASSHRRRMAVWMFLMLLLSGNIHPIAGPELHSFNLDKANCALSNLMCVVC